jgi:hypothetical protein
MLALAGVVVLALLVSSCIANVRPRLARVAKPA